MNEIPRKATSSGKLIDEYVAELSTAEKKKMIKAAAGMWKDKKDIPDIREMRKGWGRRLKRLGLDDN